MTHYTPTVKIQLGILRNDKNWACLSAVCTHLCRQRRCVTTLELAVTVPPVEPQRRGSSWGDLSWALSFIPSRGLSVLPADPGQQLSAGPSTDPALAANLLHE